MLNRLLFAFALFIVGSVAVAQNGVINPQTDQSQLTRNKGQLPATATNDAATAGNVGEFVQVNGDGAGRTATITIATPTVITEASHRYSGTNAVVFTNSGGALPTGIVSGTTYYTEPATTPGNPYRIATSVANAMAGTFVATSGSQSGTQTAGGPIALSSNVVIDTMGISLTAGNWLVWTTSEFQADTTTVVSNADYSFSTTSVTRSTLVPFGFTRVESTPSGAAPVVFTILTGPQRISINATTTYFGVTRIGFATSTLQYNNGGIFALRVR